MLYLLDANILITASNSYYAIDQVPEFWSWLQHQAAAGYIKIPQEVIEEIEEGRDEDPLKVWISNDENKVALMLEETVDATLVQRVVTTGYAPDLTDDEVEKIGRDPFLIAYALVDPALRCVVTTEVSKPSAQRQNRKVPDVCATVGVECLGPFALNKNLGFHTGWRNAGS
jgi:Domain of unknown function (DUF4411)